MLKLKYLFENYDLAKEALNNWEHDKDVNDALLQQFRISSNAIYPFTNHGKVELLRLAPTEEKLEQNVFGELEFIGFLHAQGYPALQPVRSLSGELALKLSTQWGDYYACVFKRVSGEQIEDSDFSEEIMLRYGAALGKLHELSEKFVPKTKKWSHTDVLRWIREALKENRAPEFVFTELSDVDRELSKLPRDTQNYGLIHYDFEPDNVFYDARTKTCNVIDFDDGMYHWYALDLEQVFDSLGDELEGEKLDKAKAQFIKGYQTVRPYTPETEALLPLMRRFCNLYTYARLTRSVAEHFPDEPDWMVGLRKKLGYVIDRLEESMKR